MFEAYVMLYEAILTTWDHGMYTRAAPAMAIPFMGLLSSISWSRTRGESRQNDLVGMVRRFS
eukprot:SAG31_NODE_2538_length_5543_cov_13.884093_2_plen_62_part_00